uniref:Atos homolog protein B n=1 Tax=Scleropages formosus TaxID=113540 RepID=A0A8C9W9J3_SCLFO
MRHIHVEIAHKEAQSDHPAQEGDLPPSHGMVVGLNSVARQELRRPFGEDKIKLQKVYQLSVFSQMGGFSDLPKGGRLQRNELKRGLQEQAQSHKRPHLEQGSCSKPIQEYAPQAEVLDGEMLCGSGQHFCHTGTHVVKHTDDIPLSLESAPQKYSNFPKTYSTSSTSLPGSSSPISSTNTCSAKKKLLSSSDTGESCSEDEGPSTSKRSRLALQAPGLCLGAFRSTDAKAAPFWNHLLPCARERPRVREFTGIFCTSTPFPASDRNVTGVTESILKGRFSPSGRIEGFTAEIGASGSYCPQHATLPVEVTYYDIAEHNAPSPFLGVIYLEPLGKKGYSVPKAGTIQVTLFNPNKTVVKMFLVTYNFGDMPVNHMTFLRHRIFLVPVEEEEEEEKEKGQGTGPQMNALDRKKILCYLIHLRFQSSKSGKIYLHNDIRLLFSRKSIEMDTGIPYELKSFTEVPKNPQYSPRV